ncbi:metallophosphoesterase family protein, partial [Listeria monocytogenes]|nr:metallophosphoesterase family protein [Listeria monocytogenes]
PRGGRSYAGPPRLPPSRAMKIRLLSDLHHEHFDGRRQLPEVEADGVVLAGDIHSHLEGLHWARETFADSEIVYVAGNHE